jgi:hypothetical protein
MIGRRIGGHRHCMKGYLNRSTKAIPRALMFSARSKAMSDETPRVVARRRVQFVDSHTGKNSELERSVVLPEGLARSGI